MTTAHDPLPVPLPVTPADPAPPAGWPPRRIFPTSIGPIAVKAEPWPTLEAGTVSPLWDGPGPVTINGVAYRLIARSGGGHSGEPWRIALGDPALYRTDDKGGSHWSLPYGYATPKAWQRAHTVCQEILTAYCALYGPQLEQARRQSDCAHLADQLAQIEYVAGLYAAAIAAGDSGQDYPASVTGDNLPRPDADRYLERLPRCAGCGAHRNPRSGQTRHYANCDRPGGAL